MINQLVFVALFLALASGQLIKIPFGINTGLTILDTVTIILIPLALFQIRFKLHKPPLWYLFSFGFILVCIISLFLTPLKLISLEYVIAFSYIIRFSLYIFLGWLFYLGAFNYLSAHKLLYASGLALALGGLLQLIFIPNLSFLQADGWDPHYFRAVASFLDPNFLGAYLVLTLLLLIRQGSVTKPRFQEFLFLLVFLSLALTFSRSSYLMFAVAFLTYSIIKKSFKLVFLTVTLCLTLFVIFSLYSQTIAQPRNIDRQQSAQNRLNSWEQGQKIWEHSPLLGAGFNNYRYALKEYNLIPEEQLNSRGYSSNDSSLLYVAATTGIIGLTFYLLMFLSLALLAFKNIQKNKWGAVVLSALVGLLIHSFFANSLFYPFILFWIVLAAAQLKTVFK